MSGQLLSSKVVIVEEEPKVRGIPSAPTSVAGAVGVTERGPIEMCIRDRLHRLDTQAMAPDYDEDFKEPVLVDSDDDGVGEPFRREHPPVRVPCQVEPEAFEALRMATSGNTPRSSFDLVFHFRDLEQLGLVDAASGDALIRPSDRLGALYARDGQLVQAVRTPPGLYVTEALSLIHIFVATLRFDVKFAEETGVAKAINVQL